VSGTVSGCTEIDTFSRITALGDTKAGLTYEYGTTTDSRALASRASVPGGDAVLSIVENENPAWHPLFIG
jgi:hypothetical protein